MEDLYRARLFYEKQGGASLGDYFFDSLFSDIDSLTLFSGIHPVFNGFQRMLSKRFPYAIYYRMESDSVAVVWRVLDMRRNPEKLKKELA